MNPKGVDADMALDKSSKFPMYIGEPVGLSQVCTYDETELIISNSNFELQAVQFEIKASVDVRILFGPRDCVISDCNGPDNYNIRFGGGNRWVLFHDEAKRVEIATSSENLVSWTEFKSYVFR